METFQWRSKAEINPKAFGVGKTLPAGRAWEISRYDIERSLGLHGKGKQNKCNKENAFVVGYRYQDWIQAKCKISEVKCILESEIIKPNEQIFVVRKPMRDGMNLYKPCTGEIPTGLTEDERINQVIEMNPLGVGTHASAFAHQRQAPEDYICYCCGMKGHYRKDCQKLNEAGFIPLDKRRRPTGIPSCFLKAARTEEELNKAWITLDGRLVVDSRS